MGFLGCRIEGFWALLVLGVSEFRGAEGSGVMPS